MKTRRRPIARKSEISSNCMELIIHSYYSVEGLAEKIKSDPAQFDGKVAGLQAYDQKERIIIEAGSLVRGGRFDIWGPEKGITKYFSPDLI
jgi:hypothetical protein